MKKKIKVVSRKNLPSNTPTGATLLTWLVLDHINAPGWLRGVMWTLIVIVWIAWFTLLFMEERVELWKDKDGPNSNI